MNQKKQEERNQKEGARRKEQEKKLEKLFSLYIKIKQANLEKEIPVGGVQVLVCAEINIKNNNNFDNTGLVCRYTMANH